MAEQRTADRLPLTMNVQLIARGINRRSCLLRDISLGGALLEMRGQTLGEERPLQPGDVILIRMFLGEGRNIREHELRARIAHADTAFFGVSFFNPDDQTLQLLLRQAERQPTREARLDAAAVALIGRLGQQLLGYCRGRLPDFFRQAEQSLFEAADHARSNAEQRLFFDAVTALRKHQAEITSRFAGRLQEAFSRLDAPPRKLGERPDVSGLALVDKDQFEEWLVVKVIASRLEVDCRSQLFGLQVRLDELAHCSPGHQINPFVPAVICEALQHAITVLRPPMALEKVLYRSLEASVLSDLNRVYAGLNQVLIDAGVVPELDLSRYLPQYEQDLVALDAPDAVSAGQGGQLAATAGPVATAGQAAADPVAVPAGSAAGRSRTATAPPRNAGEFIARRGDSAAQARFIESHRDAQSAVAALRQLLDRQSGTSPPPPEASDMPPAARYFELADLQAAFAQIKSAGDGWRQALDRVAATEGTELAGPVLSVIQMTDGLLKTLAQNQIIGDRAKAWFRQLELPLLHSLVGDDDLFQREDHPARQVLNRLARLGFRDHPLTREQEQAINALVTEIAGNFDQDAQAFDKALAVLEPMVKRQDQAYQRNLERVRQLAEGEHRLESARQRVREVLDGLLAGKRVPQPVLTLIEAGWRDLLVKTHMRQGESGADWLAYTGLLAELLAIGADMHREFDLREVLRVIKAGLQQVGDQGGRLQQQAITELRQLLGGPQRLLADVAWVHLPAKKAEAETAEERWLQKWTERAARLQIGDWLELRHRGSEAERMRLAWRAADQSRFVFVNHQGIKVSDFSLRELAALLHAGNALVFEGEDAPVVDEALDRVVHQLYDKLAFQAMHDELTGLVNRAEFTRHLQRAVDGAKRQRARHVLCCINLDQFKLVNQTAGLATGDKLLREVAHLLGKALKPKTTVARLNADEFGVLLEDCDLGQAQQLISLRLGELAAMKFDGEPQAFRLTASAGLVDITYTSENDANLLHAAEEACAQAKRDGGNRIQVYHPDAAELARRDNVMVWVAKLNQALEDERLTLRCQRIQAVDPARREQELPHYEILLGMRDDGGEDLPPSEFVQAAERYNRMLAVDRWVVDSALHWLVENPKKLERIGMVSINLSGHSLSDAQMMSYVFDRLLEYRLPPEKLCFEITETTAISNLADTVDLMRELKKIGCRFALDDFGAGHATYNYLKHLPLDYVKIDGAFVRDLGTDANDLAMVRSINDLAHYMGIQTIAEYVEDDAILAKLVEIGVDYAQGYGIERPRWLDSL